MGQTKTRLCPPLTAVEAATLYEALLRDTIALAGRLEIARLVVAVTPPAASDYFRRITPAGTTILPVEGADIGECLDRVLRSLLAAGHPMAIAFNSDGPTLPLSILREAVARLEDADVVVGPSEDGGYYLIGLKRPHPELFQGITWSTPRVMTQTRARAEGLGLAMVELPHWYDVDSAAELERLRAELETLPGEALVHTRRFFADRTR